MIEIVGYNRNRRPRWWKKLWDGVLSWFEGFYSPDAKE